jgi:hypothetical protein
MQPDGSILRQFISEHLVVEKIRSKTFSIKKLKELTGEEEVLSYIESCDLQWLKAGSSRTVYVLSSKWVLKIAMNDKGLAQNIAEKSLYNNAVMRPFITAIKDSDPDNRWLIAELVRPLKNYGEFEKLSGVEYRIFEKILESYDEPDLSELSGKQLEWMDGVLKMIHHADVAVGDLFDLNHWGKTNDGRMVLLDYGLTRDVLRKHYRRSPTASTDDEYEYEDRDERTSPPSKRFRTWR